MKDLGYYNGKIDLIENMTIPMNDRACYFGDGIYEVAYARNYKMYCLDEHLDRLYRSADKLGITVPLAKEEFKELLYSLVKKVDSHEQLVYWQISRGTAFRIHAPKEELKANIWVTIRPLSIKNTYDTMKLITMEDTRFLHCDIKTINLIPSVMASIEAQKRGVDETVFHRGEFVTECAHSNISIIRADGALQTAPTDNKILAGIARGNLIKFCKQLDIPVIEEAFTLDELMNASEVIVTASGTLCGQATEINGVQVGGKAPELLKKLQDALLNDFIEKTN